VLDAAGIASDTREAGLLSMWLFSKVDPMRLLSEWQLGGLDRAKTVVAGVFEDPTPWVI
jgi:hypothetical protein